MVPVRDHPDDESDDEPSEAQQSKNQKDGAPLALDMFGEQGDHSDHSDDRKSGEVDARAHAAWRSWLGALATDPKAAMAAALAYESLPAQARDAWLEALDVDAPGVRVPRVALYAPLLAVEGDEVRRARIQKVLAADAPHDASARHALRGTAPNGDTVCVVVSPLYLDFVELLVCRYGAAGIASARHEPLSHLRDEGAIPEAEGAELELTPLTLVVEELAHAVVAHRRAGKNPLEALQRFTHLFAPKLGRGDE
jgi:hypothetical protein